MPIKCMPPKNNFGIHSLVVAGVLFPASLMMLLVAMEWLLLPVGFAATAAVLAFACCGWNPFVQQASYGSGENPIWNSFIDTNPAQPNSKRLRMQHEWSYMGSHGVPGTVDKPGKDHMTGHPLTGHLIGRHVWTPGPKAIDEPAYPAFDASSNRVRKFRAGRSDSLALAPLAELW